MVIDVLEIQGIPSSVGEEQVWTCLGSRDRRAPGLVADVATSLALGRKLCEPRAIWVRVPVEERRPRKVLLNGEASLEGRFMAHCFRGAKEAVVLLVTIGPELEARVSQLFAEGNSVEAFVLDAVGTATVADAFGQVANRVLAETEERGWKAGMCLRPGQSYWDITGQRLIFGLAPTERIGVELLESCFMQPQKCQSAVIPLGPDLRMHGDPNESPCRYCEAARCPMRQEPLILERSP